MSADAPDLSVTVTAEIADLHRFFVDWVTGTLPASEPAFEGGFLSRMDPAFRCIEPDGAVVSLQELAPSVRRAHGKNPAFSTSIHGVILCATSAELVVATYEERQQNALSASSPDNTRRATAVFRVDPSAPRGLRWLHVQETLLPG
jgi:hypothetical protein